MRVSALSGVFGISKAAPVGKTAKTSKVEKRQAATALEAASPVQPRTRMQDRILRNTLTKSPAEMSSAAVQAALTNLKPG